ncbi:B12-binding domain-containing radical SAM protein, partial [candidate division CSSED10-310 bacterium]
PQSVLAEISLLQQKYNPDQLWFADDLFTLKRDWVMSLTELMIDQKIQIPFECLARVDRIDPDLLRNLHLAGCYRIWFGAESGSETMIHTMNKGFQIPQVRQAVDWTQKSGIDAGLFILIGYPGETLADLWKTLRMIKELNPEACGNSVAYPIKGTPFYDLVKHKLSADYAWSKRNENRIAFRGRYPELFYWFAIRLVNNWAFFWRGVEERDKVGSQSIRAAKCLIAGSIVLTIGCFYDFTQLISKKNNHDYSP